MAITAVEIVQTNIVGDCDLLAIHSPLIFLANATYNTAPPDNLYLFIYDKDDVLLGSYKSLPNRDISPTVRQFRFRADQILRQWLRPMEDFTQADNTLVAVPDMTKQFKIKFSNESTVDARAEIADSVTFEAVSSASQFGETEAKQSLFNNESQCITGVEGKWAYAYFYDKIANGTITASLEPPQ